MIPLKASKEVESLGFSQTKPSAEQISQSVTLAQELRKIPIAQRLQQVAMNAVNCCGVHSPVALVVYNPDTFQFEIVNLLQTINLPKVLGSLPELPREALRVIWQMPRGLPND